MLEIKNDGWMIATLLHALLGSVLIATVLSILINYEVAKAKRYWLMGKTKVETDSTDSYADNVIACAFLLYIMIGVVWGVAGPNKWSFVKSLYFSFFAVSTGRSGAARRFFRRSALLYGNVCAIWCAFIFCLYQ